ncbi:hypothetical protein EWM64_g2134 [Hericium alpestre]|uniref:F-box domain-containing protein n=1 Tax=Hericium alpestre TaxID=135208 RepID=A0A4Z0A6A3_9AGAM|nr:hypothetical protein EWM64_g2134 [Hericium alpestre]
MPSLWTYIRLQPGGWPQEFLRRSRDCNLRHVVFFPSSGKRKQRRQRNDLKQLAANTHRLESLYLRGDLVYRFFAHDTGPAPRLWNLYLTTQDASGDYGSNIQRRFVIPSNAFAGVVPALRELNLEDVPMHPDSSLLTANLTHLALSRGGIFNKSPCPRFLSLLDLLAVLRRMPNLCSLKANDILTEPESTSALDTALDALQTVWLPELRTVKIHSPWIQNYRGFVRMVEYDYIPEQWDMGTTLISLESHHFALLPYDVTTYSVPGDVPPLASLRIRSWHAHAITVEGWRTTDVEDVLGWMRPSFSAELSLPDARACDGAAFLCGQLPLHTVEKLAVDWRVLRSIREGNPENWVPLLQAFAGVRCLQIEQSTSPQEIIAALAWTGSDDAGNTFLVCPGLCELRVCCVPWKGQREHEDTNKLLFEPLASVLEIRARHGSVLRRLVVKDKIIPCAEPGDLDALRQMRRDQ